MKIVFFDLDGTILPNPSSEKRFFFWLLRKRQIGLRQLWRAICYSCRRFFSGQKQIFITNKAYLTGLSVSKIAELADAYVQSYLVTDIRKVLRQHILQHQQAGDIVVLLTATLDYIAHALAKSLGIVEIIATECTTEDGRFCWHPPMQLPYAQAKLELAEQFCRANDAKIIEAVAYGNSRHDLFLLQQVGEAIAVTPDRRLRRVAKAQGWRILG